MNEELKDYIVLTSEASAKTRVAVYMLVVASILLLSAALNSFQGNWMKQRLRMLADKNSEYSKQKVNDLTGGSKSADKDIVHSKLYDALFRDYVNNTYTVNVPFFGVSFDVNDLGILGGVGIVTLMAILYFSLNREYTNLAYTLRVAESKGALKHVYTALAMKQVLARPKLPEVSPDMKRQFQDTEPLKPQSDFHLVPKIVIVVPVFILFLVFIQDLASFLIGMDLSQPYTVAVSLFTLTSLMISAYLCFQCLQLWKKLDEVWQRHCVKLLVGEDGVEPKNLFGSI